MAIAIFRDKSLNRVYPKKNLLVLRVYTYAYVIQVAICYLQKKKRKKTQ